MVRKTFKGQVEGWKNKPLSKLSIKLEDGTVTSNHGIKKLDTTGEYDAYSEDEAGYQEIVAKGEAPDHMEVVRWKNAKLLAAAKAAENAAAVKKAGFLEPSAENDNSILLMTFYTAFIAVVKIDAAFKGLSEAEQKEEAKRRASEQSGHEWPADLEV